jgi:hypothetical protein
MLQEPPSANIDPCLVDPTLRKRISPSASGLSRPQVIVAKYNSSHSKLCFPIEWRTVTLQSLMSTPGADSALVLPGQRADDKRSDPRSAKHRPRAGGMGRGEYLALDDHPQRQPGA